MKTKKGIAYFKTFEEARGHGQKYAQAYPEWRCVCYELGWAVQVRVSGPYLGPKGEIK